MGEKSDDEVQRFNKILASRDAGSFDWRPVAETAASGVAMLVPALGVALEVRGEVLLPIVEATRPSKFLDGAPSAKDIVEYIRNACTTFLAAIDEHAR